MAQGWLHKMKHNDWMYILISKKVTKCEVSISLVNQAVCWGMYQEDRLLGVHGYLAKWGKQEDLRHVWSRVTLMQCFMHSTFVLHGDRQTWTPLILLTSQLTTLTAWCRSTYIFKFRWVNNFFLKIPVGTPSSSSLLLSSTLRSCVVWKVLYK